jgi:HEAT repeat protein
MAVVAQLVAIAEAKQPWFWASASVIALVLLLGNILLLVAVHARRIREGVRGRRAKQARAHVEELLAELGPGSGTRDPHWLGDQVARFDELERPIAARMLIERLMPASEEERRHALQVLREAGVVDVLLRRGARSFMPWRRALAIRTLGWIGATEAVPLLIERAGDRNRWIAQAAVRALGRIGDADALGRLAALFRNPGPVGTGVVYDALIGIGRDAQPVFAHGLESPVEAVRVASCFGVSALSEPDEGRRLLDPVLADPAAAVRAAAAEAVADVSGDVVPETLARATRDDVPAVRRVAVVALGFFADPRAVDLAAAALVDPDREVAIRAGESLVRLTRLVAAAPDAVQALTRHDADWPVERARTLASLEAV